MINIGLKPEYEMSQAEIGEAIFLKQQTVQKIEIKAIENFKQELANRGIDVKELLNYE